MFTSKKQRYNFVKMYQNGTLTFEFQKNVYLLGLFTISFSNEFDIFAGLILFELKIAVDGTKTNPANA